MTKHCDRCGKDFETENISAMKQHQSSSYCRKVHQVTTNYERQIQQERSNYQEQFEQLNSSIREISNNLETSKTRYSLLEEENGFLRKENEILKVQNAKRLPKLSKMKRSIQELYKNLNGIEASTKNIMDLEKQRKKFKK